MLYDSERMGCKVCKMEMEVMWQGDTGDNFFKFDEINKRRKIKNALLPLSFYNDKNPVPKLEEAAERILSLDVALMATTKKKKNDASSLFINNVIQTDDTNMQSNFVYSQTYEGKTTDELGIIIMRYFYHYKCTQLVLDCQGKLLPHLLVIIDAKCGIKLESWNANQNRRLTVKG